MDQSNTSKPNSRPYLAQRLALAKSDRQSSGELYETFLNWGPPTQNRKLSKWHHYFDVYERHLARFRGTECHLLEFGVFDGGSLLMWSDYLGPKARITAVDINPYARTFHEFRPNVNVVIGNQADKAVLAEIVANHGPFDIAIDDGGHTARQQINTFNEIYGHVVDHGVYICEDTHTSYWPDYQDIDESTTMMEHAKKLIDEMHSAYRRAPRSRFARPMHKRAGTLTTSRFAATTFSIQFYDSIIVFEKRPRAEPYSELR